MNGTRGYAWMVVVANDELVNSAIASGKAIKKTNSCGSVLALVSNSTSKSSISQLELVFDLVIVKDVESLASNLKICKDDDCELNSLLISALNMTTFAKLLVIRPGVLVLRQSDQLFDSDNLVMRDDNGNWQVTVISPEKKRYAEILEQLERNDLSLSSSKVISCLVYSGNWKNFSSQWILYPGQRETLTERTLPTSDISVEDSSGWIAIVGMSCRFPNANTTQEYWDLLASGQNACTFPPEHRSNLVDLDSQMKANFLKCPIDQFDASFFGLSPSEATFTDPQARLLLEVSWEAFEDAAINPEKLRKTNTGVFYGSWLQEYRDAMNADGSPGNEDFIRKYLGNSFGCSAAKLSFFYGFSGPNVSTESGCSSSMVAVDLAVKSLQMRECPVALVAGSNILLHMNIKQKVLWAEDGKSRTFDADANGYARAEGIAVLILKRLADAKRDGDRVHAVIRGSALSQEGLSKSFGTPTVDSECAAMRGALKKAKVEPWEVDYVEAHATGTAVGDPIEASAIVKAYSANDVNGNRRMKPLYIASGKTNVGHTESCSGMAGIFKVVLAMKNDLIPAHLNLSNVNPQVNFEPISGKIPLDAVPWPKVDGRPRIAGVSSFGITGTDVHVIIQEAPEEMAHFHSDEKGITAPLHILTISAKSEGALEEFTKQYWNYLGTSEDTVEDITYTANVCRSHHPFRVAVLGESKSDLRANLGGGVLIQGRANTPKLCFTFPGRIGLMDLEPAKILYRTSPIFQKTMDYCDTLFQTSTGMTLLPLLTNSQEDTLSKGVTWYALILAVQYSLVELWASWGIQPDCVMGHCIGEITAAVVSGALLLEDVFKLVKCIEYFLQVGKEQPALMMAVQALAEQVEGHISSFLENNKKTSTSWIEVASSNSFDQTVVAGDVDSLSTFKEFLKSHGYRCKLLVMDFCAHSQAVEPACQKSLPIFEEISHQKMRLPYVSSVTGKVVQDEEMNGQYWYRVFRQSVQFTESCRTASSNGLADVYIEMGLEGALSRLTKENLVVLETRPKLSACLPSLWKVKGDKCWAGLLTSLGQLYTLGAPVDWEGYHKSQGKELFKRVELPGYPFQRKSFWYERRKKNTEGGQLCLQSIMTGCQGQGQHPLLGVSLETCLEDWTVFQNWMGGDGLTKYVYDHVIETQVIYPGAAFLEMILAAVDHLNQARSLIWVEGFTVTSPLHLSESIPKRLQCVVDRKSHSGSVYAWHNDTGTGPQWKLHARAGYSPEMDEEQFATEDVDDLSTIRNRCGEKWDAADDFYATAKQVGLNFGKCFRSMTKVFQGESRVETLVEVNLSPEETNSAEKRGYVCHPILVDAMIQALILHTKPELKKLHVPVRIGKFSVRKAMGYANLTSTWYVYCKSEVDTGVIKHVHLLNTTGEVVAIMTNAELVMTSVESILKAAGCLENKEIEDNKLENVALSQFDVVWKRAQFYQPGNSINLQGSGHVEIKQLQDIVAMRNQFTNEERQLDTTMNELCYLYVVKMLFDLGWSWPMGIENLKENAAEKWGVLPGLVPAFNHFITYLDNAEKIPDSYDQVWDKINRNLDALKDYEAVKTVQACGSQLADILRGSTNPHAILFANPGNDANLAEHFYKTTRFAKVGDSLEEVFKVIHEKIQGSKRTASETIRILEVGAGLAHFANGLVNFFGELPGIKYEYAFSDISPSFVGKAKERFVGEPFLFKTFNIELDPLKQGFSPEYYDVVVAMDVVHATRNVKESLRNLELVTKPGGWVLLAETEKPVREVDICFGILEGYWLFEDGIRKNHCTLNGDLWLELLGETGFSQNPGKFLSCDGQMSVLMAQKEVARLNDDYPRTIHGSWVVFLHDELGNTLDNFLKQLASANRNIKLASLRGASNLNEEICKYLDENQDDLEGILYWMEGPSSIDVCPDSQKILEPLLCIGKYLVGRKLKTLPRFHVVTNGCLNSVAAEVETGTGLYNYGDPNASQAWGFMRNLRIELPGIISKSIDLDEGTNSEIQCLQLMSELWLDDKETEVAFRGNIRYLRRAFHRVSSPESDKSTLQDEHKYYTIELPKSKMISDVKFVKMEALPVLVEDEILVEVRSVSLNFKDVLAIMKPSPDFDKLTSIGLDFSGVVAAVGNAVTKWKVGQPVFGAGWEQGAMKSHVVTKEVAVVAVPDWMTFNEAATLPAVWLTAWYCMREVAKLRQGQTVLVHAASGGVGLIAIQIANLLGVQVIGTAGTERKRNFLRSLGVKHVFNSRTTEFGQQILELTNGNGVDMVLNCLTGPGFKEASLQVCKKGGHFVEISKLDIWTPTQVKVKCPEVDYTIVDVTQVDKNMLQEIMNKLTELLEEGTIRPLPYTLYSAPEIKEALTYLQKAKQIGKVIVKMPQFEEENAAGHKECLFNDRSSYLITGGKGAIGLSVAKWMVTQGAKHLVLVGRSEPTEDVKGTIKEMEQRYDATVVCKEVDITDLEQCKQLFAEFGRCEGNFPPLRGIHHCAGILSDKLLSHHDNWSSYESVIHPKVTGAWNLHNLTKDLPMEFFVLYSSAASTFGNIGQSNYVAANSYLDSLAEMRVAMGLPCLSINWGQWNLGFAKDLTVDWLHPFTAEEGLIALESLMKSRNSPTVVTGLFDFYGLLRMTPYYKDTFLETLSLEQASFFGRGSKISKVLTHQRGDTAKKPVLRERYLGTTDESERQSMVREFVMQILCETLGTKPEDIADDDQHFSEMGMDSLMSIEFANKLNSELEGCSGGGSGFFDLEEYGSVNKMTVWIRETLRN